MTDFMTLQRFRTRQQGVRAANQQLTLLEGDTEQGARAAIESGLAAVPPSHWSAEFTEGVHATLRDALAIIDAHRARRERAESDAEQARQRAETERQRAVERAEKAEKAALEARARLERAEEHARQLRAAAPLAGARHDAYAEQREADARRPVPRLYDARWG